MIFIWGNYFSLAASEAIHYICYLNLHGLEKQNKEKEPKQEWESLLREQISWSNAVSNIVVA